MELSKEEIAHLIEVVEIDLHHTVDANSIGGNLLSDTESSTVEYIAQSKALVAKLRQELES